jgi:hypothetical protein
MTKLVFNFFSDCGKKKHKKKAVAGRFPGVTWRDKEGVLKVAAQTVPAGTALTGKLVFVDQFGQSALGPIGSISSSVVLTPPASLSADGQSFNFTSPPSGDVTLLWHDPTGAVPDFTGDFSDQVVLVVTGAFGTAVPGTTA